VCLCFENGQSLWKALATNIFDDAKSKRGVGIRHSGRNDPPKRPFLNEITPQNIALKKNMLLCGWDNSRRDFTNVKCVLNIIGEVLRLFDD